MKETKVNGRGIGTSLYPSALPRTKGHSEWPKPAKRSDWQQTKIKERINHGMKKPTEALYPQVDLVKQ